MNCIFNDLSFAENVDSPIKLQAALQDLSKFQILGRTYGHETYIHRDGLYKSTVCGQNFRQAINTHIQNRELKNRIFRLLDTSVPALPDDTAVPAECRFSHDDHEIPCTGLAECAFRLHMEEPSLAYSLACASYDKNPLPVIVMVGSDSFEVNVPNFTRIETFTHELDSAEPDARSWKELLQRASRLSYVRIEESAKASLFRETFETSLCKAIWERFIVLNRVAASSGNAYFELTEKYCHGDRAWFSNESQTRINSLQDKLYFMINGTKTLCSFHGKISNRTFRIHMDKQPVPGELVFIAYIGYKIL